MPLPCHVEQCHFRATTNYATTNYDRAHGSQPVGSVRKLPSGRSQARYCVDLAWHNAPTTFRTKREADAYLASVRADVDRGSWIDPDAGKVTFEEYSSRWLAGRP